MCYYFTWSKIKNGEVELGTLFRILFHLFFILISRCRRIIRFYTPASMSTATMVPKRSMTDISLDPTWVHVTQQHLCLSLCHAAGLFFFCFCFLSLLLFYANLLYCLFVHGSSHQITKDHADVIYDLMLCRRTFPRQNAALLLCLCIIVPYCPLTVTLTLYSLFLPGGGGDSDMLSPKW